MSVRSKIPGTALIFLFLALFAVTACGRAARREPPIAPTAKPASTQSTDAPTSGSGILNLGSTGKSLCKSWEDPKPEVSSGGDMRKLTLQDPKAICNDGTPAVLYIKPAQDAAKGNEWIFHLQGGGGCNSYEECRMRWCGENPYDAAKMSTRWTPETIKGKGIFSPSSDNSFAGANQVYVYYCSSDLWSGQKSDSLVTNPDDPSQQYILNFRGHTILETALQVLRAGAKSDDGAYTLPNLANATDILFTGTSAGSYGVVHNIDWFTSQFNPAQTTIHAVMDASYPPDGADYSDADARSKYEQYNNYYWSYAFRGLYNGFVDQSCLSSLGNTADAAKCTQPNYLMRNQITTPFFARQDLQDPVISNGTIALGSNMKEYGKLTYASLLALLNIPQTAAQAAQINFVPGVYGPDCGQHVALLSDTWFFNATVKDASGKPFTFHDALRAWLNGQPVLIVDTFPATLSNCQSTEAGGG